MRAPRPFTLSRAASRGLRARLRHGSLVISPPIGRQTGAVLTFVASAAITAVAVLVLVTGETRGIRVRVRRIPQSLSPAQTALSLLASASWLAAGAAWVLRARVVATRRGLVVHDGWRAREVAWGEVDRISVETSEVPGSEHAYVSLAGVPLWRSPPEVETAPVIRTTSGERLRCTALGARGPDDVRVLVHQLNLLERYRTAVGGPRPQRQRRRRGRRARRDEALRP